MEGKRVEVQVVIIGNEGGSVSKDSQRLRSISLCSG